VTPGHSASIRVRPRTNGTVAFDVRYRLDSRSKTTSFDNQQAAERWARIVRQIGPSEALKLLEIDSHDVPTVDEYAERFIASKSGREPRTFETYRTYMRTSISPAMGTLPVDAVLPERIAAWVTSQQVAGSASKTIKNRHGFLYAMFQHAMQDGLVKKNPCEGTGIPKGENREMVFLRHREFDTLYQCIPDYWKPFVRFLVVSGCRFNEATALRPGDFDLDSRSVRVSRAWKSSAAHGWYIGAPKTDRSKRTITLPDYLVDMLRPLVQAGNEYVFTNTTGGPIRQPNFFTNVWNPARRLANGRAPFVDKDGNPKDGVQATWRDIPPAAEPIGKWPRIHDLRHTCASWLINAGVPIYVIQRRLGHESMKTTADTYSHLSPDVMYAAADVFAAIHALAPPESDTTPQPAPQI